MADERYAEYKEAFTLFDSDGDGFITTKELGTVLRALGKSPTEAEIKTIVKDIDPDGRGVVDYKEFEKLMTRDIREYDNEQDLKAAWKVFDKAGQGSISTSELRHVLTSVGEKLSPEEIGEMLAEADPEKSGRVVYDNFIKMMLAR
ncbi:Calmodulin [Tetrabaena socialis]|uniref:Calmodulin n=1 Tax=Tetrabaena socialis TaxID=47790 RepID=A0A2J7ZS56_9CHLO|nr:Calmodulin [Tetrabaena socialis]|eukprot:PNH03109.1 Calmodulin [Tetrabaena socialis]